MLAQLIGRKREKNNVCELFVFLLMHICDIFEFAFVEKQPARRRIRIVIDLCKLTFKRDPMTFSLFSFHLSKLKELKNYPFMNCHRVCVCSGWAIKLSFSFMDGSSDWKMRTELGHHRRSSPPIGFHVSSTMKRNTIQETQNKKNVNHSHNGIHLFSESNSMW